MCGIVGILAGSEVRQTLYEALTVLQHRGQDAAGIVTYDGDRFYLRKGNGLVRDVFFSRHMRRLSGESGIGHVRYPTAGSSSEAEAQPIYVNSPYGLTLAHNGNLTNAEELKKSLFREDLRHINTGSDSEVLLNVLAHELQCQNKVKPDTSDIFNAIRKVHERSRGAYAAVGIIAGIGLFAFRDPHGIRPLAYGQKINEQGEKEFMIASESVVLSAYGFNDITDVEPGEAIFVDFDKNIVTEQCAKPTERAPCIFEYVYLARPDSVIDGVSVYNAHINMGKKLANKVKASSFMSEIDVVIPIPDTSRPVALELAQVLGLTYREGFIKNRYIGRTFIMPEQSQRRRSVRQKLNAIISEFKDKNVLLVDDSIVRGTTSQQIIQMARDSGANKVFFASASPPVRYPNVYGIDMPTSGELIGYNRDEQGICEEIGADGLVYQDLSDLEEAIRELNPQFNRFETSIFDGQYVTGDIDEAYLQRLESHRKSPSKEKLIDIDDNENLIDLQNTN